MEIDWILEGEFEFPSIFLYEENRKSCAKAKLTYTKIEKGEAGYVPVFFFIKFEPILQLGSYVKVETK